MRGQSPLSIPNMDLAAGLHANRRSHQLLSRLRRNLDSTFDKSQTQRLAGKTRRTIRRSLAPANVARISGPETAPEFATNAMAGGDVPRRVGSSPATTRTAAGSPGGNNAAASPSETTTIRDWPRAIVARQAGNSSA